MNICYKYLRPGKGKLLAERYSLFASNIHPLRLDIAADAMLLPPPSATTHDCGVATLTRESGITIHPLSCDSDSADWLSQHAQQSWRSCPKEQATVLYAGYLNPHWGHFIMDSLSRLWPAFLDDAPHYDHIIFLTDIRRRFHPNILQTLELTGLMDKIRFIDHPIRFSKVIVPETGIESRHHYGAEVERVYETIGRNADSRMLPSAGKKIYLSRGRLGKARLNEPGSGWTDEFFAANGYTIIYPEQEDAATLITALRGADTVAALSGTLPHNMVFARPGTRLEVIEKSPGINNYQQAVDLMRRLDALYIDANAMIWTTDPGLGPFIIYPNHLMRAFCADMRLTPPAPWTPRKKRNILKRFFSLYRRHYGRQWILPEWMECEISILREAYADSSTDFGCWISGRRLLDAIDLLSPRYFAKWLLHLK